VQPPSVHEDGGLAVEKPLDAAAPQREVGVAGEGHDGREVYLAGEPRLHLVDDLARDGQRAASLDDADMIVHGLRDDR